MQEISKKFLKKLKKIFSNIIKSIKMCVYENCPYLFLTKKQHHYRFAIMRRNSVEIVKTPSLKVNWDVVKQLKIGDKPIRKKKDNDDELYDLEP